MSQAKRPSLFKMVCRMSGKRSFTGRLPPELQGGWHMVIIHARRSIPKSIVVLRMSPSDPYLPQMELVLAHPYRWSPFGFKFGVFYLPRPQAELNVEIFTQAAVPASVEVTLLPIWRLAASVLVCLQNFGGFRAAWRTASGGIFTRLRRALANTSINGQSLPSSYTSWLALFDAWPAERIGALTDSPHAAHRPAVSALVCQAGGDAKALAATLQALSAQILPACETYISRPGGAAMPQAGLGEYVAILQAGEIIPAHALLLLADELVRQNFPEILFADEDRIDSDGQRSQPLFKPQPNLTLMCSGLLSRGIWLVRREWLHKAGVLDDHQSWAEILRLRSWFEVFQAGRGAETLRIPYLLTHRAPNTETAPPKILAETVEAFLARAGMDAVVTPNFPLRIQWRAGALGASKISIIVPSRLRGDTQLACLRDILEKTTYPNFDMLVLVNQAGPLDEEQRAAAAQLAGHDNLRIETIESKTFNYSAVNNVGAARTSGEFICLLNDDVAPMQGDWLERMVGFFADQNCGIVGAKLFYPNLTTQHGGVIMGLSGLVEHANRFLPRGEPGYAWRAELDQELSAVTGACLLVRRDVFEKVGGLDEEFPTAFNDIDFCLRVREAGSGIVFAASVEMIHHETLTFGQHYSPEKAEQEADDIRRLRARWSQICQTDPFHNPNLSLVGRSEWNLAYPPRKQDEAIA
jgi:GT2 family glycosyltransferase